MLLLRVKTKITLHRININVLKIWQGRRLMASAAKKTKKGVFATPSLPGENRGARWWMLPAATVNHMCLGGIFAWSMLNEPLTRLHGVVTAAGQDWTLGDISVTFSLVMGGFVWGALLGQRLDQWGPRKCVLLGAGCLLGGFSLAAAAAHHQSLVLLYSGGLVWGMANGLSYVPPCVTLMSWFPDRKGFASGSCILGFGAGAAVAAPLFQALLARFRVAPRFLGPTESDAVSLHANEAGHLIDLQSGCEVVVAAAKDLQSWDHLLETGVYVVGSGSTGVAQTFLCMGVLYSLTMATTSFIYRVPAAAANVKVMPATCTSTLPCSTTLPTTTTAAGVTAVESLRLPQFWIAYSGFGLAITGCYGILSSGKTMLSDAFPQSPMSAAAFVACLSVANLSGRLFWSNLSDVLVKRALAKGKSALHGRKQVFAAMWGLSAPTYLLIVWSAHQGAAEGGGTLPLYVFIASQCFIIGSFGGTAATRPALASDLFGARDLSTITARQLSVILPAALLGPRMVAYFRDESLHEAARRLALTLDPRTFEHAFGTADLGALDSLIQAKTVTIARLMELVPPGTVDPSAYVYDRTMIVCGTLQAAAFITNSLLKDVVVDVPDSRDGDIKKK